MASPLKPPRGPKQTAHADWSIYHTAKPAMPFLEISCDPRSVLSSLSGQNICLGTCQACFILLSLGGFMAVLVC